MYYLLLMKCFSIIIIITMFLPQFFLSQVFAWYNELDIMIYIKMTEICLLVGCPGAGNHGFVVLVSTAGDNAARLVTREARHLPPTEEHNSQLTCQRLITLQYRYSIQSFQGHFRFRLIIFIIRNVHFDRIIHTLIHLSVNEPFIIVLLVCFM